MSLPRYKDSLASLSRNITKKTDLHGFGHVLPRRCAGYRDRQKSVGVG
jgi:hypothetical protein